MIEIYGSLILVKVKMEWKKKVWEKKKKNSRSRSTVYQYFCSFSTMLLKSYIHVQISTQHCTVSITGQVIDQ